MVICKLALESRTVQRHDAASAPCSSFARRRVGLADAQMSEAVAIVGCGLVGSGWAIVFARAGCRVGRISARCSARSGSLSVASAVRPDFAQNVSGPPVRRTISSKSSASSFGRSDPATPAMGMVEQLGAREPRVREAPSLSASARRAPIERRRSSQASRWTRGSPRPCVSCVVAQPQSRYGYAFGSNRTMRPSSSSKASPPARRRAPCPCSR